MKLVSIQSELISQIGFEEGTQLSLGSKSINIMKIIFTSGNIYNYYGVDIKIFEEFVKAENHDMYFAINIKDNYQYEKVNK